MGATARHVHEGEVVDRDAIEIGEIYAKARPQEMALRLFEVGQRLITKKAEIKSSGDNWTDWLWKNRNVLGFNEQNARRIMAATRWACKLLNIEEENRALTLDLDEDTSKELVKRAWGNTPHVANNSGENEWYTPRKYIESARKVMGSIDLDPASSAKANETVQAEAYYTAKENGLEQEWYGNVWLNPPYSKDLIVLFANAVIDNRDSYDAACVLVNNATETEWLQRLLERCDSVCFIEGRIKYLDRTGEPANTPLQGQAILYFGPEPEKFKQVFEVDDEHGEVFRR